MRERMMAWRDGRAWMTNVTLCLLGLGLLLLTKEWLHQEQHFTIGGSGCSGWSAWLYVAAMIVVMTQPVNRATYGIIVGFGVAFCAVTVLYDPFSSSDVYRYVWDGIVQHAHVNPYRYVPGDAALTYLRAPHQDVYDGINRRDYARTIYPPVAQMVYWLVTFFSPTVEMMKLAMVGFLVLGGGAIVALLKRLGRRREEVLLYAWCPLLAWEIGGAGHVDAVVIGFLCLALLFRHKEQPVWMGLFLGLAVWTKFYPIVLLPALYKRGDWKMPAVVAGVGVVGYSVYLSAGGLVFGFLGGYSKEEGLESGARFFLLDLVQRMHGLERLPVAAYEVFCVVVLGGVALWCWRYATVESFGDRPRMHLQPSHDPVRVMAGAPGSLVERPRYLPGAAAMGLAMMLLFSPHYSWYIVWLIPLFALTPNLPILAYLMGFFYLYTTSLADPGPKMFLLNKILYAEVAVVLVVWLLVLRRWPLRRMFRV